MTALILNTIKNDFQHAVNAKKHPFRYCTLATSDNSGRPRLRTVVLRDFDTDWNFFIYTDKRSKKITHIIEQEWVSVLFYDPEKLCQVVVRAKALIVKDDNFIAKAWKEIPDASKRDYTTTQKPGEAIKNPDVIDYLDNRHFFTILKLIPDKIEYLKLKRPHHTRVCFKKNNNEWNGTFLVP